MSEMKKNRKNEVGATKADTAAIPAVAIFALGAAMADGAKKYEAYNYRESEVTASVFHNAMNRHHWDWWEGEDFAPDSLVHHLGHLMACCAIVLDSIAKGNFIDDRPKEKQIGVSRMTRVWKGNAEPTVTAPSNYTYFEEPVVTDPRYEWMEYTKDEVEEKMKAFKEAYAKETRSELGKILKEKPGKV